MKIEIKKVDKEIEKEADEETFGIELIPENKEEHGILERFWDGGVKVNGYSSSGQLQLTFADLIQETKETKKESKGAQGINEALTRGLHLAAAAGKNKIETDNAIKGAEIIAESSRDNSLAQGINEARKTSEMKRSAINELNKILPIQSKIDPKHICPHCGMDKRIRNPSGYCDHLHYPESCKTCQAMEELKQDLENFNRMITKTKKETKGVSPEEFFKKMKNVKVLNKEEMAGELNKILHFQEDAKQDFFDHLVNEGIKAVVETIISKTDNVEIETENQRIRMRINFK